MGEYILVSVLLLTAACISALHINAAKFHKQHRQAMSEIKELKEQHRNA